MNWSVKVNRHFTRSQCWTRKTVRSFVDTSLDDQNLKETTLRKRDISGRFRKLQNDLLKVGPMLNLSHGLPLKEVIFIHFHPFSSDFPWHQPTSYWGTPMMGRRHHPRSGSELGKVEAETRRHPVPWRKKRDVGAARWDTWGRYWNKWFKKPNCRHPQELIYSMI